MTSFEKNTLKKKQRPMQPITPIGKILSPFQHMEDMPIQPRGAAGTELTVIPFMDTQPRGVYATRSPLRPNHIGISIVRLEKIQGNVLDVLDIDVLDGTPLLDIKPYMEKFDSVKNSTSGWMQANEKEVAEKRSDSRFT